MEVALRVLADCMQKGTRMGTVTQGAAGRGSACLEAGMVKGKEYEYER